MPIIHGDNIQRIVHAGEDIVQVRQGSELIWSSATLRDDFNRDDGDLGDDWTSYGIHTYKLGVVTKACRMAIPDGLVSLALNTDRARFNAAVAAADDYELEFRIGSQGASDSITGTKHRTQVLARVINSSLTHGVGVDLYASQASIFRRVTGLDTIMEPCGAFAAGDVGIMRGVGNLHSLYINGEFRGEWDDSAATAAKGSDYRSLAVRCDGSKDLLGPRRFSPSLDYVQLS